MEFNNDRLFNLQLTVQKLEEELNLYRNGTTSSELLSIISEKEKEIDGLTQLVLDKNEKFKKLKQTSQEVLNRCDNLNSENDSYKLLILSLNEDILNKQKLIEELQEDIVRINSEKEQLFIVNGNIQKDLEQLEEQEQENNSMIDKLQSRCALVLSEKMSQSRAFDIEKDDMLKQLQSYEDRYNAEKEEKEEYVSRLGKYEMDIYNLDEDNKELRTKLNSALDTIDSLQSKCDEHWSMVTQLSRELGEATKKKSEYADMLATVQQHIISHTEIHKNELASKDAAILKGLSEKDELKEAFREERDKIVKNNVELKRRVDILENEHIPLAKREIEILRVKNKDLELKLKESSVYGGTGSGGGRKAVPLGDRTNAPTVVRAPTVVSSAVRYMYEPFPMQDKTPAGDK